MIQNEQRLTWYKIIFGASYTVEMNYITASLKMVGFKVHQWTYLNNFGSIYIKTRNKELLQKKLDELACSFGRISGRGFITHLQDLVYAPF